MDASYLPEATSLAVRSARRHPSRPLVASLVFQRRQ